LAAARLAPAGTFVGRVDEAGLLADLPVLLARDPFVVAVLRQRQADRERFTAAATRISVAQNPCTTSMTYRPAMS